MRFRTYRARQSGLTGLWFCVSKAGSPVHRDARLARHVLRVQDHASDRHAGQHSVLSSSARNGLDRELSQHATDLGGLPA